MNRLLKFIPYLFTILYFSILAEAKEPIITTDLMKLSQVNNIKSNKEDYANQEPLDKQFYKNNNHSSSSKPSTPLSLKDAIKRTLENNVAIAVEDYNSKVKTENVIKSKSEFDATFKIDLSVDEKTQQQASAFSSPNKSRNKNHNWDVSLRQKLLTGADYELSFKNQKNTSNSKTLGLNPNYSTGLEFSITQPLLKNFGIELNKHNIYIAHNEINISEHDFKSKVIEIISNAENIYWDLVFSIEDLKVKKKTLERAKDLERHVKAKVSVGTMAEIDTLQAKSDVASREEALLVSQDLILDNEDRLKNILNISFNSPEGLEPIHPSDTPAIIMEELDLSLSIKEALSNRPDYLGKKKELENQNIQVKYQENQIYPSIDLVGSLGLNGLSGEAINITSGTFTGKSSYGGGYGQALSDSLSTEFYNWTLGVKLSYPLGNRSAKSKLAISRLETAKLILSIKDLEKKIVMEVREAIRQLKTDLKRIEASKLAKKLAEKKLKAEEKKFEVGLSTSFNVLEFQEDYASEQSNEIKALIDYNQSKVRYRKFIASSLKVHNIKLKTEDNS